MPDKVASQLPYSSSWLSPSEFAPFVSRKAHRALEHVPAGPVRSELRRGREPEVAWSHGARQLGRVSPLP